ncbi:CDK2-associated and cullin domain-containing protein 1 isoform X3 [Falco naumanni]|uniref:CDK2-associated and cullin domain-containing protein 1 isoform X3 n=1 Tax=Falco naumanni TaxID=148594 RepID=UPI001ADE9C2E|nr:CDK2-associated and cullin domain-containing protein 1 isoform X3 [Falco naumanni]
MEEESMEEEGGCEAMMDDQNHNNWGAGGYGRHLLGPAAAPLGDRLLRGVSAEPPAGPEFSAVPEANGVLRGCESGAAAAAKGGAGAIAAAININASTSKFLMNVITIEDYKSTYWPKLDSAIDQLLTQSPGDYIPISYEQIYSCVYKCVCQQHSEQMYSDLIKKITNHLERVSKELQNKFYIETKLNRDLKDDLIKLFTEHVAEKHIYNLMPSCHSIRAWKLALLFEAVFRKDCKYISALLLEAQSTPFQITPSTMANIVKGLYTLRPEWVQMAPALFSKFIPNILPPAVESELQEYAAQDQKLQRDLMQNGFTRGDQSRKRAGEELTYNGSSACASSRGYR